MNLRQIEVFRAVMLAGSVTDAARLLHVSQPGISRMLAHVELQLGLSLFERRKGKLLATPEAQALFAEVEQVYRGVARIDECALALKSGKLLTLRVLASPSTGLEMVPRAIAALTQQFPAARIYLEILAAREMVKRLVAHEADVAISTLPIDDALLTSKPIGRWTLACVFPKGHPFEQRRSLSPRDILRERLIAFSADTPQGRIIADWCARHRCEPDAPIEVRAGQAACAMAACGAGVAIVDDLTARGCMTDRLGFRPIAKAPSFDVFAVTNESFAGSLLARRFVGHAEAALQRLRRAGAGG
ncbi:LysR family transcriptional regulator [Variovorax sp. PBL-E5]|uniref:LysR family transcriptional regulator n=1 Tax=Variovorax sp. PBL-E5 TaxID=434014 RepID=UPI001315D00F|nr:LysR substrate-binding domain-containing protein [Variovorax sp. PBL-E5]VTU31438.1 HTH-type transcriptional activator CmpR [Variovorax sp. PBL-E5]